NAGTGVVADQQHTVEVHSLAGVSFQPRRIYILVFGHLKLLSGNIYDRVHSFLKMDCKVRKRIHNGSTRPILFDSDRPEKNFKNYLSTSGLPQTGRKA